MKRIFLLLSLLCVSANFVFAQTAWKGFYQARFFNLFGETKIIEAEFEVREDNKMIGKLKMGAQALDLEGRVEPKGKFEVRTKEENGAVTIVKGELPGGGKPGKVELVERTEQRERGGKSVSKTELNGFISRMAAAPVTEVREIAIAHTGKTELWFQHPNPFFGKEWKDHPASVKISKIGAATALEVEMKSKTETDERRFRFRVLIRQENQKIWAAREISLVSYAESKNAVAGADGLNFFFSSGSSLLGGQIEIVGENEREIVFKFTGLRVKKASEEKILQIDGYVHAAKPVDPPPTA